MDRRQRLHRRPPHVHHSRVLFGEKNEQYFAWLPSVPQGKVEATYRADGRTSTTTGIGYHDHNWGNTSMLKLMHHWYRARGEAGPYSVIASCITAEKAYGCIDVPLFMLARDGEVIADDAGEESPSRNWAATPTPRPAGPSRASPATPTPTATTGTSSPTPVEQT